MAYIVGQDKKETMIYNKDMLEEGTIIDEVKTETEPIVEIEVIDNTFNALDDFKHALEEKKKQEEEERKKRQAYWNNYSRGNSFYYHNQTISEGDYRDVFFYEWSCIDKVPKRFNKVSDFQKWAEENGVMISEYTLKEMKTHLTNYATCHKGNATILLKHSYDDLKQAFDLLYRPSIANKTEPPKNAPMTGTPCYPTRSPYDDYDEDYYTEMYGYY